MNNFEQWFINQDFYTNMRFIHGDTLFLKDGDVYRVLPVQIAHQAWQAVRSYPEFPDSSSMREQFEKAFPEKLIFEYVDYDPECNMYGLKKHVTEQDAIGLFTAIANLNGAWWAWSYQQKKVDALIQSWNEKGMRGCSDYVMGAMHSLQNCTDELSKVFGDVATVGTTDVRSLKGTDE